MTRMFIKYDPLTKKKTWLDWEYDESSGMVHSRVVEETMLPDNFSDVNRHIGQATKSTIGNTQDHRRLIARIPDGLWNVWHQEDCELDLEEKEKRFRKRMNDIDYRNLRVYPGRI